MITPKGEAVATQNPVARPSASSTRPASQGSGAEASRQEGKHTSHGIPYDIGAMIRSIYSLVKKL